MKFFYNFGAWCLSLKSHFESTFKIRPQTSFFFFVNVCAAIETHHRRSLQISHTLPVSQQMLKSALAIQHISAAELRDRQTRKFYGCTISRLISSKTEGQVEK